MSKPLSELLESLDAFQDGDITVGDFQELRRALAAQYLDVSGVTQQQFGRTIDKSSTIVQRIVGRSIRWAQCEVVTSALGLPEWCLTDVEAAQQLGRCAPFVNTLDAVVHYQATALKASKSMPRDYVIDVIEGSELEEEEKETLLAYFESPTPLDEAGDLVIDDALLAQLEQVLGLPPLAIRDPQTVADTRSRSNRIAHKTRKDVALNVKRMMREEGLDVGALAEMAGRSVDEINALFAPRHKLSLSLFFALAGALAIEPPARLMEDPAQAGARAAAEQVMVELPAQPFQNEPLVVRAFLSDFLSLAHEKQPGDDSEPTGAASLLLLLTPLLHSVVLTLNQNSAMLPNGQMPDLAAMLAALSRGLANQR